MWKGTKLFHLKKIKTKLNKNNVYENQIKYKILTLTQNMQLSLHVEIF